MEPYLVFDGEREVMRCECMSVVIKNEALAKKYPGGVSAFVQKHRARSNRHITVCCEMSTGFNRVIEDALEHGLTPYEDITEFDIWSYALGVTSGGREPAERHDIDTGVSWLKGEYSEGGFLVWYEEDGSGKMEGFYRNSSHLYTGQIPAEVIDLIGPENFPFTQLGIGAALDGIEKQLRKNGLQWVKDNVESIRWGLEQLVAVE